jgi:hypothetical protein
MSAMGGKQTFRSVERLDAFRKRLGFHFKCGDVVQVRRRSRSMPTQVIYQLAVGTKAIGGRSSSFWWKIKIAAPGQGE